MAGKIIALGFLLWGVKALSSDCPSGYIKCGTPLDVAQRASLVSNCPSYAGVVTMGYVCSDNDHTLYGDLCGTVPFVFRNCIITTADSVGSDRPLSPPGTGGNKSQCPATANGSVINIDAQTFTESIPIVGTGWSLNYDSQRTTGYRAGRSINVAVLGTAPPSSLSSVDIELKFAGRTETFNLTPVDNLNFQYTWDHLDSSSNPIRNAVSVDYAAVYENGTAFELNDRRSLSVGTFLPSRICMAGWNISPVHFLDVASKRVWLGDGTFKNTEFKTLSTGEYAVLGSDEKTAYVFSIDGRHIQTRASLTGQVLLTMSYDSNECLTKITDAFGNETQINRSGSAIIGITSPFGKFTAVSLDTNGYISSVTNPASETYNMTYASNGLMATFQKPEGQVTTFTYDADGNLIKELGAFGNFWEIVRNLSLATKPLIKTSQMGRATTYEISYNPEFDESKRSELLPTGEIIAFTSSDTTQSSSGPELNKSEYKSYSNDPVWGKAGSFASWLNLYGAGSESINISRSATLVNASDPFSISTRTNTIKGGSGGTSVLTSVYDNTTKTNTITSSEGVVQKQTIDLYGRPAQDQLGTDNPLEYSYDTFGRVSYVKQGTSKRIDYFYNTDGTLQKIRNALSYETLYGYDLAGRVTTITRPDLSVVAYEYDQNGNVIGITPPSKPKHIFEYNLFEAMSKYSPPNLSFTPKDTTYTYNLDKQISTITRPDGKVATYTYNATTGLLTSIASPAGPTNLVYHSNSKNINVIGNAYGMRNVLNYSAGALTSDEQRRKSDDYVFGRVSFGYTSPYIGKQSSVSIKGNSSSTTTTLGYSYNLDAQVSKAGSLYLYYSYPSGRLSTTTLDNVTDVRTYDLNGDLESYTAKYIDPSTSAVTVLYSYSLTRDLIGRITQKIESIGGSTNTWEYQYNIQGRLSEVKKNSVVYSDYTYDSNGNKTSGQTAGIAFTATYDDQDRQLTYNSRVYSYNKNGDLSQIQWNTTDTTNYNYDVFGNLDQFTEAGGTVHDYIVDPFNRRVGRKIGTTVSHRYIYQDNLRIAAQLTGPGVVQKIFAYAESGSAADYMIVSGVRYRIFKDHLGSPRLVVRSSDGVIQQQMDYNEWGKVINDTNPGFQPFGFAGGLYDQPSKLVRFGKRDYDPEVGRWTSKDPILFRGGDTNLYGYVANDPVNWVDPDGLRKNFVFQGGNLSFYGDAGELLFEGPAASGPWGNGSLPRGNYSVGDMRNNRSGSYSCSGSDGYSLNLHPQFPTNRTELRIHPDGGTPGTLGCIGVNCSNGAADALGEILRGIYNQPMTPWIGLEVR